MSNFTYDVAVIGLGYVGLPLAIRGASVDMDMALTADLFHGQCGIMRQLYKAFPSLWHHHQSHSYSPIRASGRVYPHRELGGYW